MESYTSVNACVVKGKQSSGFAQAARGRNVTGPSQLGPSAAILASGLLWGTLWIPLRQIDAAGLGGAWATTASFTLPLVLILPWAAVRARRIAAGGWPLAAAGLFMALSVALYAEGLLRGSVARVILLFYLTPVWSTLMGRFMLGEPITGLRIATIVLGLSGLAVVVGVEHGMPLPRSAAEWMGLIAGVTWGLAMVYVRRTERMAAFDRVFVQFLFVGPLFLALTLVPGGRSLAAPDWAGIAGAAGWLITFGVVWMLPVIWLTVYGGSRLDPGKVAILLMFEIIAGLTSAAILTDEPFGLRELIGAVLIMAAGGVEIFAKAPAATEGAEKRATD